MGSQTNTDEIRAWGVAAARAADAKLGADTTIIDVGDVLAICDLFIITSGGNSRQVRAIAEAVQEGVAAAGGPTAPRVEGLDGLEWVLIDYGSLVVHVFAAAARSHYQLEKLWSDRPVVEWKPLEPT
ncbi:MAG: ribosome silencing factor [Acidimicrobiales bacterium]